MPSTFQALSVLNVALLPGALYVWSFERLAGAWGVKLSDRFFRFVGVSAVFHAIAAPATYGLWSHYVRSGRLASGRVPLLLWVGPILYVAAPIVAGTVVGWGTRSGHRWTRIF